MAPRKKSKIVVTLEVEQPTTSTPRKLSKVVTRSVSDENRKDSMKLHKKLMQWFKNTPFLDPTEENWERFEFEAEMKYAPEGSKIASSASNNTVQSVPELSSGSTRMKWKTQIIMELSANKEQLQTETRSFVSSGTPDSIQSVPGSLKSTKKKWMIKFFRGW